MTNYTNQSTKVVTGLVRFSYAHVFEPNAMDGQEPKYSVTLLIPKNDRKTIGAIENAIRVATEAGRASKFAGKVPGNLKTPLRDGDVEKPESPEYEGMMFINCSSRTKPGVVDKDVNPILDTTEFYSGCYGRASINLYAFNTSGNKGIAAGLNNVQKVKDGDYLGGRNKAEDDFSAVSEEDFDWLD